MLDEKNEGVKIMGIREELNQRLFNEIKEFECEQLNLEMRKERIRELQELLGIE